MTVRLDGLRLRELRMGLGLTMQQVGEAIGKTRAFVWQLETEAAMPSSTTITDLQQFFGVSLHDSGALVVEAGDAAGGKA
jgi:transcriptional regulator with XRE-family HTH domain